MASTAFLCFAEDLVTPVEERAAEPPFSGCQVLVAALLSKELPRWGWAIGEMVGPPREVFEPELFLPLKLLPTEGLQRLLSELSSLGQIMLLLPLEDNERLLFPSLALTACMPRSMDDDPTEDVGFQEGSREPPLITVAEPTEELGFHSTLRELTEGLRETASDLPPRLALLVRLDGASDTGVLHFRAALLAELTASLSTVG
jgi:hypothetical protein